MGRNSKANSDQDGGKKPRKRTSGLLRDKDRTKARMVAAVGKVLQKKGYPGLTAPNIARAAGVDKKLVWTYFGGVDNLIEEYITQKDFWKSGSKDYVSDMLSEPDKVGKEQIYTLLQNQFDVLLKDKSLQKIIHWEMGEKSKVLRKIADEREEVGERIFEILEADRDDSNVNLRATLALMLGGIYYLSLHAKSNGSKCCGIDINEEAGKKQIDDTLRNIIYCAFTNGKT
ncbi:TetR/AcrR family transcriptional regulator [Flavobacterium sp.]|uniref:TetR/AcrR family transcriptional regulator n=1 Tax=Flavobacterium sp. TaxID=239 RepID=UPI003A902442